jgi:inosine/xanthosine triphosphate pyrophosphatase family protein
VGRVVGEISRRRRAAHNGFGFDPVMFIPKLEDLRRAARWR